MNLSHSVTWSHHATTRSAQRAIPQSVIVTLLDVGVRDYDHKGGIRVHVHQHRSRQRFIEQLGRDEGERFCNCYCIIDSTGSEVITMGWLNARRTVDPQPPHRRRARRAH